jgi:hypothetical protein
MKLTPARKVSGFNVQLNKSMRRTSMSARSLAPIGRR